MERGASGHYGRQPDRRRDNLMQRRGRHHSGPRRRPRCGRHCRCHRNGQCRHRDSATGAGCCRGRGIGNGRCDRRPRDRIPACQYCCNLCVGSQPRRQDVIAACVHQRAAKGGPRERTSKRPRQISPRASGGRCARGHATCGSMTASGKLGRDFPNALGTIPHDAINSVHGRTPCRPIRKMHCSDTPERRSLLFFAMH